MRKFKVTYPSTKEFVTVIQKIRYVYAKTKEEAVTKADLFNKQDTTMVRNIYFVAGSAEEVKIYGEAFDWFEELRKAQKIKAAYKKGKVSHEYYFQVKNTLEGKSADWTTCACGNACDIIPRICGEPCNTELWNLGFEFHNFVSLEGFGKAITCLMEIEALSAKLITEELEKRKDPNYTKPLTQNERLPF